MVILKEDNLEELVNDGNYMLGVTNETKFPHKTKKI